MASINLEEIDFSTLPVSKEEMKAWLQENKYLVDEARELWLDLETQVVSAVENPSHPSEFVALKSDEVKSKQIPLLKDKEKSEEKQIAYAPAMVADTLDAEKDLVPAPIVEKAAHQYMQEKRNEEIDADHETPIGSDEAITSRGTVVESWVLKEAREFEDPEGDIKSYPQGTWMIGVKFKDEVWNRIKEGEIEGYSIMGTPTVIEPTQESQKDETLKGEQNNNTSMSETESTEETETEESEQETEQETVSVSMDKDELVSQIVSEVKEEVSEEDTEEETEEEAEESEEAEDTESEKSLEDFVSEKEIMDQDLIGIIADHFEVDVAEISDALAPFMDGEESNDMDDEDDEEEESEDTETEEDTESEKSEDEVDEENHYKKINRMITEKKQSSDEEEEATEKDEEEDETDGYADIASEL